MKPSGNQDWEARKRTSTAWRQHISNAAKEWKSWNHPPETPTCDDPSDQKFIILAYQAGADALVTKDRTVLALKEESEVPILTWQESIALLANA